MIYQKPLPTLQQCSIKVDHHSGLASISIFLGSADFPICGTGHRSWSTMTLCQGIARGRLCCPGPPIKIDITARQAVTMVGWIHRTGGQRIRKACQWTYGFDAVGAKICYMTAWILFTTRWNIAMLTPPWETVCWIIAIQTQFDHHFINIWCFISVCKGCLYSPAVSCYCCPHGCQRAELWVIFELYLMALFETSRDFVRDVIPLFGRSSYGRPFEDWIDFRSC